MEENHFDITNPDLELVFVEEKDKKQLYEYGFIHIIIESGVDVSQITQQKIIETYNEIRSKLIYPYDKDDTIAAISFKSSGHSDEIIYSWYDRNSSPFERIRRITGYLVGTLDRFNNAKRQEERERVKHDKK